ncbi:MAG: DUF167 domain-containing protein [Myxococcota bacterium]
MLTSQRADGVYVTLRVKPRASKSRVLGEREGALEVAVAAPPVDGEANAELVRTLASFFGVSRSQVQIASGQTGKNKLVRLNGIELAAVELKLKNLR